METRYQHAISLEEAVVVFSQYAHIEAQSFPVTPNPRTQHTQSRYCMMKLAIHLSSAKQRCSERNSKQQRLCMHDSKYCWLAGRIAHMLNLLSPRCTMYNTKLYHVNEGHSLGMRGSRLYTLSLQKLPKHDWSDQLSIITSITETYLPSSVPSVVIKKVICTPLKGLSCNQWTFTRNAGQPNLVLFVIKPASIVPADSTNETLLYSLLRFHI